MRLSVDWLKELTAFRIQPSALADRLTMAGLEVKSVGDTPSGQYFEAEITSNRADWLSHLGVAREIAALTGKSIAPLRISKTWKEDTTRDWKLTLQSPEACPYYTGVSLFGVSKVSTPDFMVKRLEACGHRSISFLVDVTNYVLLLTGQPLHAFDADHLSGKEIQIRSAHTGEKLISIKGNLLELQKSDLVIADRDKAVALAGVMGGKSSEISDATQNVFLESAFFTPSWVRKTSQRTGLKTDSSYRFERRVDPDMVDKARDLAVQLICQYAKPESVSAVYRIGKLPATKQLILSLTADEIERHVGLLIPLNRAASILKLLGLNVKKKGRSLQVKAPSFRTDLTRPIDLIEEVARIHGYDKIPETLHLGSPLLQDPKNHFAQRLEDSSRNFFSTQGYFETVTFSFVPNPGVVPNNLAADAPIVLKNPMAQELTEMRRTLLHSHLEVLSTNIRQQADSVRIYEIANIYGLKNKSLIEEKRIAISLTGKLRPANWTDGARSATFFDLKGLIDVFLKELCGISNINFQVQPEHPWLVSNINQLILAGDQPLGWMGQVQSSLTKRFDLEEPVYYAELSWPQIVAQARKSIRVTELQKYPAIERDIAFILDETVPSGALTDEIRRQGGDLVCSVELFDCFQGGRIPKGKKNVAYRILYQSPERTLLAEEVHELHFRIAHLIQDKFQASFQ